MNGYEYDRDMYVWKKYNTKNEYYASNARDGDPFSVGDSEIVEEARGLTANPNTGEISCTSLTRMTFAAFKEAGYTIDFKYNGEWCWYDSMYNSCYKISVKQQKAKDSYIGEVTATSRSEYPDNGASGNYWYVYDRFYTQKIISEYKVVKTTSTTKIMSQVGASAEARCYSTLGVLEDGTIFGNESQSAVLRVRDLPSSDYPYTGAGKHWYKITSKSGSRLYTVYGTLLSTSKE